VRSWARVWLEGFGLDGGAHHGTQLGDRRSVVHPCNQVGLRVCRWGVSGSLLRGERPAFHLLAVDLQHVRAFGSVDDGRVVVAGAGVRRLVDMRHQSTSITGGARASANDFNGRRWLISCPSTVTFAGAVYVSVSALTTTWQLCPDYLLEATANSGATMRNYFMAASTFHQRVVAR